MFFPSSMITTNLMLSLLASTRGEWSGVFDLDGLYTWTATKHDGAYAASWLEMSAGQDNLPCDDVDPWTVIAVPTSHCQRLHLDETVFLSVFLMNATNVTVTIVAEHHPAEFNTDAHYSAEIKFEFLSSATSYFLTVCVVRSRSCGHSCRDKKINFWFSGFRIFGFFVFPLIFQND